jgi:hypothetical protein
MARSTDQTELTVSCTALRRRATRPAERTGSSTTYALSSGKRRRADTRPCRVGAACRTAPGCARARSRGNLEGCVRGVTARAHRGQCGSPLAPWTRMPSPNARSARRGKPRVSGASPTEGGADDNGQLSQRLSSRNSLRSHDADAELSARSGRGRPSASASAADAIPPFRCALWR